MDEVDHCSAIGVAVTDSKQLNSDYKSYLPRHVEDLDQGQRHRDEAEHQVGDGQVDDENVPGGSHVPVPDHDLC